ncbi:MAG: hypothetical protein FWF21_15335 [Micrococcales bacterium]|nr:hypothetical protein [Micrococcales bacterium]
MVMVGGGRVEEQLVAGELVCPCGGVLGPWGSARVRRVRGVGRLCPRRARCRVCQVTHVLLDSVCVVRRADGVEVIGSALQEAAGGAGFRTVARRLGVPQSTVRGWLRAARANAAAVVALLSGVLLGADPLACPVQVAGSLAGVVEVVGAAGAAVVRRLGALVVVSPWRWASAASQGRLLSGGLVAW